MLNPTQLVGEGETLEVVGRKVGLSDETLRQGLYVLEAAPKEDLEKLDKGEAHEMTENLSHRDNFPSSRSRNNKIRLRQEYPQRGISPSSNIWGLEDGKSIKGRREVKENVVSR